MQLRNVKWPIQVSKKKRAKAERDEANMISHLPSAAACNSQLPTPPKQQLPTTTTTTTCAPASKVLSHLLSASLAVALNSPLPASAIPSLSPPPSPSLPTTPFSQSKNLQLGLEYGKIRACPSINPGCVSTNAQSSSFAFPWGIPPGSGANAIQKLQDAILKTQKNAKILVAEDTSAGQYLQAEVDGGFGRDVLEFLVKGDVVSYRCMAAKVTYIYPFTTAFGDSKGQEERMKKIVDQLGWDAPSFDSMD